MKKTFFWLLIVLSACLMISCDDDNDTWKEPPIPPAPPEKLDVLTKITDPVFKSRILFSLESYDTDKDGKLSEEEAATISNLFLNGGLHAVKGKIKSLDGIEYFTGLISLDCANNELVTLDLSKNPKIDMLNCAFNELTVLNIKENKGLAQIRCNANKIKEIDIVDKKKLTYLDCSNNLIESILDLQNSPKLEEVYCNDNQLSELLLGEQKNLTKLYCYNNVLKNIDVGNCESLKVLSLENNQVEELDISKIKYIGMRFLDARNNPNLKKVWVPASFRKDILGDYDMHIPESATISIKYYLPEQNDIIQKMSGNMRTYFEEAILNELSEYDTDEFKGQLSTAEAALIPKLDISGKNIVRLYCTEYFTELSVFDFSDNKIRLSLSFSNNTKLEVLNFSNNNVPNIEISECQKLQKLNCDNNRLKSLNMDNNRELTILYCRQNQFSELDISHNKKLLELDCTNNTELKTLYVWKGFNKNQLTHFGIDAGVDIVER